MPRDIIRASLWDLRAQYENELRTLTAAQKCVDEWRSTSSNAEAARALAEVRKHVVSLIKSNSEIAFVLKEISSAIDADPPRRRPQS